MSIYAWVESVSAALNPAQRVYSYRIVFQEGRFACLPLLSTDNEPHFKNCLEQLIEGGILPIIDRLPPEFPCAEVIERTGESRGIDLLLLREPLIAYATAE